MIVYMIRTAQAAIVRRPVGESPGVGLYTGGGADFDDRIQSCLALLVPAPDNSRVGMYHYPFRALSNDGETTMHILESLLTNLHARRAWIYWGYKTSDPGAPYASSSSSRRRQTPRYNPDVKELAAALKRINRDIEVVPQSADEGKPAREAEDYCTVNGYLLATIERRAGENYIKRTNKEYFPDTNAMLKAQNWPPGIIGEYGWIIANTDKFPGRVLMHPP